MKVRNENDEEIRGNIAKALNDALDGRDKAVAADLLKVELGTLYKYLAGDMIPGGQVLWRACSHFGLILDANGLQPAKSQRRRRREGADEAAQLKLPFINESLTGNRIEAQVRRKGSQFVRVSLRIKLAG